MIILKSAAALIAGILLMGIWFGLEALLANAFHNRKVDFLMPYRHLFTAAVPVTVILLLDGNFYMNLSSLGNFSFWLISIAIALVSSSVTEHEKMDLHIHAVIDKMLDGMLMEIPMRLMMQVFVWYIMRRMGAEETEYTGIVINALIWCAGIIIQNVLSKGKWNIRIIKELDASFLFSLGAGWLLAESDFIVFPMIAHALERAFSAGWRAFAIRNNKQ